MGEKLRVLFVLGCFLALASAAWGKSPATPGEGEEIQFLEEVVIGATKTERLRTAIPANITILTAPEIAASGERNLDEVLRQQAGIDLTRRQGIAIGIPGRLDVRGVPGPNRTLVVVDGFPLNGSGTGFVNLQQIPLDTIARVEIIRGPYSSLYGANALGGVINIITKRGQGRPDLAINAGVGNYSWHQTSIASSGGNKRADYYMYGDRRRTEQYWFHNFEIKERFVPALGITYQQELPAYNRSYEDWRYLGNHSFSPAEHTTITLHTRYFKNYTGLGRTENLPVNRDSQDRGEVGLLGLNIKSTPSDNLGLLFRAYARQYTDKLWNESSYLQTIFIPFPPPGSFVTIPRFSPGYFRAMYRDYYAEAQTTWALGAMNTLTGGVDFLAVDVEFDPVINKDTGSPLPGAQGARKGINTVGFYLQDEFRAGNWNIIPGLRVDKHSLFEAVLSPKLGISYTLWEKTTLRASAGRAYRAPSVTELFRPEWNMNPFIKLRPNANLKPEYIWSVDGGIEHRVSPELRVSVDGFYNNMKDFIVTPPVAGAPGFVQYQNLGKSWSAGLEAAMDWRVWEWLTFSANYTYVDSYDKDNRQPIQSLPDHKFNVGLRVNKKWGDWRLSGSVVETFIGRRLAQPLGTKTFVKQPSFALTDAALYLTYKEIATIGLTCQNLLDRYYQEAYGYLGPGRLVTAYAGLRGRF